MGCAVNNSTFPEVKRVGILLFGVATGLLNLQTQHSFGMIARENATLPANPWRSLVNPCQHARKMRNIQHCEVNIAQNTVESITCGDKTSFSRTLSQEKRVRWHFSGCPRLLISLVWQSADLKLHAFAFMVVTSLVSPGPRGIKPSPPADEVNSAFSYVQQGKSICCHAPKRGKSMENFEIVELNFSTAFDLAQQLGSPQCRGSMH